MRMGAALSCVSDVCPAGSLADLSFGGRAAPGEHPDQHPQLVAPQPAAVPEPHHGTALGSHGHRTE